MRAHSPTMRQIHLAGEKLFVDYAGQTVEVIDGGTGEVGRLQIFRGVTRQIVCDNPKAVVTAACRYEPGISQTYRDMATPLRPEVLPTRVRCSAIRPRSKSPSRSFSVGFWRVCDIAVSSLWPNSMAPSGS